MSVADERRTRAKLSNDARALWDEITETYASPTKASEHKKFNNVKKTMWEMSNDAQLRSPGDGRYSLPVPPNPSNPTTTTEGDEGEGAGVGNPSDPSNPSNPDPVTGVTGVTDPPQITEDFRAACAALLADLASVPWLQKRLERYAAAPARWVEDEQKAASRSSVKRGWNHEPTNESANQGPLRARAQGLRLWAESPVRD